MSRRKYRVFISSVQKELETERVAVAGAVSSDLALSEWCDIVLFEKEPLLGRKVAKPYLKCLLRCDVYILILDRTYGEPSSSISATHEEYRYAQKRRMPMLIYIRGKNDMEREVETRAFIDEIKKDRHIYRRFHDRVDLLPELRQSLRRVLTETFKVNIEDADGDGVGDVGRASTFEQQILDVRVNGIDIEVARKWLQVGAMSPAAIMNHLREKGLVRQDASGLVFKAMASGLLFLGKNPSSIFPQCKVLADAYVGVEVDSNPKDQATLSESAPGIVQKVVDFVMRNTRHPIRVMGIQRVRLDEYPTEVIREGIVNALAHRDYEDSARPIYVKVFSDRTEILSPGKLMRPLTISKLVKGGYEPCSRNPILAQYLAHFGLMEQRGSGILRMRQTMLNHGLEAPEYSYRDGYFTVRLNGPGSDLFRLKVPLEGNAGVTVGVEERLPERQRQIAEWLAKGETITNRVCQERLKISKVTAMNDLKSLVSAGLAEKVGMGRSARYQYKADKR